ncbi:hypothetical protein ACFOG5_02690 [Pedobacter fastidiosus]|uniref:DUF4440 domain-containing protein n=1 Tax=Pedobacter fastidiosus TaxID=2765361 RepID=A0ABR7KYW5_9SPHI|nr:hypothetical protein [Pedobacter fastidiosus]MBC6113203.1 hypothetical protein [Pedobacter fastidiosus]
MKKLIILLILTILVSPAFAQVDTISFAKERQELRSFIHDPALIAKANCNDLIMVGAKGDISFSTQQTKGSQDNQKLIFKSVKTIPGSEYIRIYNATTAVINWLAAVQLNVAGQDIAIKVRRLEVYVKKDGSWCRVAGQGTQVDEMMFPNPH